MNSDGEQEGETDDIIKPVEKRDSASNDAIRKAAALELPYTFTGKKKNYTELYAEFCQVGGGELGEFIKGEAQQQSSLRGSTGRQCGLP